MVLHTNGFQVFSVKQRKSSTDRWAEAGLRGIVKVCISYVENRKGNSHGMCKRTSASNEDGRTKFEVHLHWHHSHPHSIVQSSELGRKKGELIQREDKIPRNWWEWFPWWTVESENLKSDDQNRKNTLSKMEKTASQDLTKSYCLPLMLP